MLAYIAYMDPMGMLPGLIPDIKKLLELCETEQKKQKTHTNMYWHVP